MTTAVTPARPTQPGHVPAAPSGRLAGKTAVITGGTTGLGHATAARFVAEGARVIVTGQDAARVADAEASLAAHAPAGPDAAPRAVRAVRADVRDGRDLDALAAEARAAFGAPDKGATGGTGGGLDIVFANAGVGSFAPIGAVTDAHYDDQFDVNVRGIYFTVQRLLPLLRPGASVILNASAVHSKGVPGGSVYLATKAAVRSLARTLAAELAPRGVRVNSLSPGLVPTPFAGKMGLPAEALEGFARQITGAAPLGRLGTPEEIASAALFLASDESRYVTAQDLLVDGGWASV